MCFVRYGALLLCAAWLLAACDATSPDAVSALAPQTASTATSAEATTAAFSQPTATQQAALPPTAARPMPSVSRTSNPSALLTRTATTAPEPLFGPGTPTPTVLPRAAREKLFEDLWTTVNENYLYPDFKGVDWKAVRDELKPKAMSAPNAPEFYLVLSEMINRLNDDHSYYIAPWQVTEEDARINGQINFVGIGILYQREDTAILVVYVIPGSPAEKAGLRRRDRITHVNGEPLSSNVDEPTGIRGPVGSKVSLTIKSPEQSPREVVITRDNVSGSILPSSYRLDADPSIGFLFIPDLWTGDMSAEVEKELETLLDGSPLKGLIIDLRGNGGGLRTALESILGQFVTGRVGDFYSQQESHPFTIPRAALYDRLKNVSLVVLIDKGTVSYAEVLAGSLQARGRAKVVGAASMGNTETIYPYDFDDGSRAWVAREGFKLPSGVNLEGRGVLPDKISNKDWTQYSERDDPNIVDALDLLK